jgi:hypothetical protein
LKLLAALKSVVVGENDAVRQSASSTSPSSTSQSGLISSALPANDDSN